MYTQLAFALDRVKAMAPDHPEWKDKQPFKAVLENDKATLAKLGEKGLTEIVATTHAGMSTADFEKIVTEWIATAKHPKFDRPYIELVYQPRQWSAARQGHVLLARHSVAGVHADNGGDA